ncbi:ATP-grasp domain-containing protein [Aeoliella mucimassa]|uniref:Carbamoyl phosphate synthase-like protein n=1 Tax=Aeoliella mucimassa TaxID=2527972 RepID=A0A518AP46_9BACT|nr:ATP-grasp domain-containing protein [Aeoliella mucimassa]QDU56500.1 carbamoyl phosphate synthase-like protein [Aeoliella mucimassa]
MNLFIYEWVCGGGYLDRLGSAPDSLQREAWAMLSALVADFAALDGCQVATLVEQAYAEGIDAKVEVRLADSERARKSQFGKLVRQADYTVIVAPEFEGILLGLAGRVERLGGRLLSPDAAFVEIASDKQSTYERLYKPRIATPRGSVLMSGERFGDGMPYPIVVKPIDGCGSLGVVRHDGPGACPLESAAYRWEEFAEGLPVSVAFLCSGEHRLTLEPCVQRLNQPTDFTYLGGELPLSPEQSQRAHTLAAQAMDALPTTTGYVGVDLVLGDAPDGSDDKVIEINPRYTTSYIGLRAATEANLAATLLSLVTDGAAAEPTFDKAVAWNADGTLTSVESADR